jgi:hypothetical protein
VKPHCPRCFLVSSNLEGHTVPLELLGGVGKSAVPLQSQKNHHSSPSKTREGIDECVFRCLSDTLWRDTQRDDLSLVRPYRPSPVARDTQKQFHASTGEYGDMCIPFFVNVYVRG